MANFGFITSSAVSGQDQSVEYKETTATPFVTPTWASTLRATQVYDEIQFPHNFAGLGSSEPGWLTGRRPSFNLQFPRGYYNK